MDWFTELFSFQGRANRAWYFWHTFLDGAVVFGLVLMLIVVGVVSGNPFIVLPALGVVFGGLVAGLAVTVKRLHDIGRPGWHCLLLLIPLYNIWLSLNLYFRPGTLGPNGYGPDPLSPQQMGRFIEG